MLPVVLTLGPVTIYSFGLFLALGLLFATYYVWKHGVASGLGEEKVLDATFLTVLGGLIGARTLYVLSNLTLFTEDPASVFAFWKGGLSFWGAVLGGVIMVLILARRLRWPAGQMFDLAAPAVALGSTFGFVGALLNGSAIGAPTSFPWGIRMEGVDGPRHPTQILEALVQLGIFFLLLRLRKRAPFAGYLALLYLLIYAVARFILEFWRGDRTEALGALSQAQLLSILIGLVALALLYLRLARLQGSWRVSIWKGRNYE